ncbi:MAG: mechanosensitive ion channel family protein [Elsteraceae bacterium]
MRSLALVLPLLLALLGGSSGAAFAADGPVTIYLTGKESPEAIQRLVDPIAKSGRAVTLRLADPEAPAPRPVKPPLPVAVLSNSSDIFGMFLDGLRHGDAALSHLGGLGRDWRSAWDKAENRPFGWPSLGLAAVIGAALAAALAARRMATRAIRPSPTEARRFIPRLIVKLAHFSHDLIGLAVYWALGHALADILTPRDDIVRASVHAFLTYPLLAGGYAALGRLLLRPSGATQRLMPLANAERHFWLLIGYALFGQAVLLSIQLAQEAANDRMAAAGLFTIGGAAITLYKLIWFWIGRHDFAALWILGSGRPTPSLWRRLTGWALPWVLIGSAIGIWAVGRIAAVAPDGPKWAEAAGLTQFLVVLTPILAAGAAALARDLLRPGSELAVQSPVAMAFAQVVEPVAASIIWIASFIALSRLWAFFMLDVVSPALLTLLLDGLWVGVTFMAGWVLWSFLNALFDVYAPERAPSKPGEDDDHEAAIQSRLGSVLPMLRAFVLGAALGLTALILLSRLGVDIGPLLAGFGIFGLALSFGSQALVRDIVSGIFFIADDAFRVGEYIDTGRLKGTVEKITLRSIQLRHQSGLVHTIPFGQIASVTNASRDWATVKFNIRLERDVDVEQARKVIKKTGQAMMEDPELAPEMILPLKLQGIAEVADNALVLRLKFTSKPARSSWIQREALKRVHAALHAAGIEFATNAVIVRGGDAASGAGAAVSTQNAVQAAPTGPI